MKDDRGGDDDDDDNGDDDAGGVMAMTATIGTGGAEKDHPAKRQDHIPLFLRLIEN